MSVQSIVGVLHFDLNDMFRDFDLGKKYIHIDPQEYAYVLANLLGVVTSKMNFGMLFIEMTNNFF